MLLLPRPIAMVISTFAPMFSTRVFEHAKLLVVGAILAPGKRTVTSLPKLSSRAESGTMVCPARGIYAAEVTCAYLRADRPWGIGMDETIERRRGENIAAKGMYRDLVRSSRSHFVKVRGGQWVSLMLLTPIPWTTRGWAVPFLTVVAPFA